MASNLHPESSIKGPLITGIATVLAALISVAATLYIASETGHLTTPSETREFQKSRQENTRLRQENLVVLRENAGLRQQNTSLREELSQAENTPTLSPIESEATGTKLEHVGDFVSQLERCEKNLGAVTCVARITNTSQDRMVRLHNDWTSIIDSTGNEQRPTSTTIGASTNSASWWFSSTTLPTNVPVKLSVGFGGVEPHVNRLARLALGIEWVLNNGATQKGQIEFRNIPLH